MGKLIETDRLSRLIKALDNRMKLSDDELKKYIDEIKEMLGGRSIVYLTRDEYESLSDEEKNNESVSYVITNAANLVHEHENKEFLDSLNADNIDASSINGYDIWVGTTEELNSLTSRDANTIYFEISDGDDSYVDDDGNVVENVVIQVDVVDGVLNLTNDKYQKVLNMVDGVEVVFPEVTGLTEIHLFFTSEDEINLSFPDNCKWRIDPNVEIGNSYELICIYNTIEWLVNVKYYS